MDQKETEEKKLPLDIQDVFKIIGNQLSARDVRVLKFMYSGIFTPEFLAQVDDGFTFLQALEKIDRVDETNFKNLENYLKIISRHDLVQYLTLRKRKTVFSDPVTEYLESCDQTSTIIPFSKKTAHANKKDPQCQQSETNDVGPSSSNSGNDCKPSGSGCDMCLTSARDCNVDNSNQCTVQKPSSSNSNISPKGKQKRKLQTTEPQVAGQFSEKTQSSPNPKRTRPSPSSSNKTSPSPISEPQTVQHTHPSPTVSPRKNQRRKINDQTSPRRRSQRLMPLPDTSRTDEGDSNLHIDSETKDSEADSHDNTVHKEDNKPITDEQKEVHKKLTCDIRLRVRAEYVDHQSALEGNVHSNKAELIERQFEKYTQANNILKSRDLGSIICDIKFSELTYLDAFWRDYINGSLLDALKGVFITESLKQAVGHEAIKLLVNVDEDDYEAGRLLLLKNLKESNST